MKKIIVLSSILLLTGCGFGNRLVAGLTDYSIICVKETGIEYVQFTSGVAPLYRSDGTLVRCGNN